MTTTESRAASAHLDVENIGGIDETDITLNPGVNVLTGRNATNRTSTLQAVMAVLGSDQASLKADAETGHVSLTLGNETYTRELERTNGGVSTDGDPLLDDPTLADLYAFLLESNEARRAVARSDNLRDVIMRPVDTDEIQAEIDELKRERRNVDEQLDELSALEGELPDLTARENRLEERLEEKEAALEAKRTEIENSDSDLEETQEEKAELESKIEESRSVQESLEDTRFDIQTEKESLEKLREDISNYRDRREDLPDTPAGQANELESEIGRLRRRKQSLESDVSELQSIIQFNEEMLEDHDSDVLVSLNGSTETEDDGTVTDQLVEDQQDVTCWTCGSTVERDQIGTMTDRIREFWQDKRDERSEIEAKIATLSDERDELQQRQQQKEQLERKIERTEGEIDNREQRLDDLTDQRDELESDLEALNDEIQTLRTEEYDEILQLHQEASQLEVERNRLEDDIATVREEITSVRERLSDRDALNEQRETIQSDLEELRTRIDRIEQEAIEAFNEHMDDLLDVLGYTNLDRIWLERTETEVREGRRKVEKTVFDLHIVRSSESGAAYEDTIDNLSESEREVTGLVFALAGFLVHDVHEEVPFMLLDSLEAIDADRIATLVDYFQEYVDYMVVALLPEDAEAMSEEYRQITNI